MLPSVFLHDQRQGSTPECIQILSGERPLNNTQEAACLGPNGAQLFRQCRVYAGSERSHSPHDIVKRNSQQSPRATPCSSGQTQEQAAPSHWDSPLFLFHLHSFLPLVNCPHYTAPNKYGCLRKALSDSRSCHPFLSVQTVSLITIHHSSTHLIMGFSQSSSN